MKVIVVGAGIIGLNCAYYLHQRDIEVSVLDAGDVCSGASAGNAGYVAPSYIFPLPDPKIVAKGFKWMFNPRSPFYIQPRLSLDLASWLFQFLLNCRQQKTAHLIPILNQLLSENQRLLFEMQDAGGFDFSLWKTGRCFLYQTQKLVDTSPRLVKAFNEYGVNAVVLSPNELEKLDPALVSPAVLGGIYFAKDTHLHSQQFVLSLANYLKENGVRIQTQTRISHLQTQGRHVQLVQNSEEPLQADVIVLANGAWAPQLLKPLRIQTQIQPAKGYSVTFPTPANAPKIPAVLEEKKVALTPLGEQFRIAGTLELAGYNSTINSLRVQAILESVSSYLPQFHYPEQVADVAWSGFRSCTPTGMPVIGKTKQYDNLFLATGHNMIGVSLANITGHLIAKAICGEVPFYQIPC